MSTRNLTKSIANLAKELECPIHNELMEQFEMSQNHKLFREVRKEILNRQKISSQEISLQTQNQ